MDKAWYKINKTWYKTQKVWIIIAISLMLIGFIGLVFSRYDFSDKNLVHIEKTWQVDEESLENLIINGTSKNIEVEFVPNTNPVGSIKLEGQIDKEIEQRILNTELFNSELNLDLSYESRMSFFAIDIEKDNVKLTIALPHDQKLSKLNIKMFSGNINVLNMYTTQAKIELKSGNMNLTGGESDTLVLTAFSGKIYTNGLKGNIEASTKSGNMKLFHHDGYIKATAGSGNIDIEQQHINSAEIEVLSGNVEVKLAEGYDGFFDLRANSGNIKSPESKGISTDVIKIRTTSGNIDVK